MASVTASLDKAVSTEIETLHACFVSWFGGHLPASESGFDTDFAARLDKSFILIQPAGATLQRDELLTAIRSGYGSNADFRIAIRAVRVRRVFDAHADTLFIHDKDRFLVKANATVDFQPLQIRLKMGELHWRLSPSARPGIEWRVIPVGIRTLARASSSNSSLWKHGNRKN